MFLKHENENNVRQVPHGRILQAVTLGKFSSAFCTFWFYASTLQGARISLYIDKMSPASANFNVLYMQFLIILMIFLKLKANFYLFVVGGVLEPICLPDYYGAFKM